MTVLRYVASTEPTEIITTEVDRHPNPKDEPAYRNVDLGGRATFAFPNDITASIYYHTRWPGWGPFKLLPRMPDLTFKAVCEGGTIELVNWFNPAMYHSITVNKTGAKGKPEEKRVEKAYNFADGFGEDWWSS